MKSKKIFGCSAFGLADRVVQVEGEISAELFSLAQAVLPAHFFGNIQTWPLVKQQRIHSGLYWPMEARIKQGTPLRRAPIPFVWRGLVEAGDRSVQWQVGGGVSFPLSRILARHVTDLLKPSGCTSQDTVVLAIPDALDEFGQEALLQDLKNCGFENVYLLWRPVAAAISWLYELNQNNAFDLYTDVNEHIIVICLGPDGVEMVTFRLHRQEYQNKVFVIPERQRPREIVPVTGFDWAANALDEAFPGMGDGAFWQSLTDFPHVWEAMTDRPYSEKEIWSRKDHWSFWNPDETFKNFILKSSAQPNGRLRRILDDSCRLFSPDSGKGRFSAEDHLARIFANTLTSMPQSHLRGVIVAGALCPSTLPPWIKSIEEKLHVLGINGISASPQLDTIWFAHESNAILDGCAEYGRRLDKGLPTYLDTLPQLAMLVEQRGAHVWEALLSAETCEGGKPYHPPPIQGKFGVPAGAQNLQVYLKRGGVRRRATLETAAEFREDIISLSQEELIEIDNKVQRAGTYEEVLKLVANNNNEVNNALKKRARELFGNPFRRADFPFPSVPDKKMPVDISVEIRPASGLAQITLAPSNPDDRLFLRGRKIFLDYSTMEEADPPPPPTRGWPSVVKIEVDPDAYFLKGYRWKIRQYLQANPADTQFMSKVNKVSDALKIIPYVYGVVLNGLKNIDQDGIAGTEDASLKIDEIANKTAEYFSIIQSNDENKKKFIIRMTWLFAKTPKNLKQKMYEYIKGPYGQDWTHMIEAAGRVFTTKQENIFLYSKILERINSTQSNPFPNQCIKALWLLLSLREDSPMAMKRVQAKTFTEEAVKKMEQETNSGNYKNKFFNAARLFLFLLRFRVLDQTFLDPDNPLDSNLFERTAKCLKSAERYFSRSNDAGAYRAKEIVIGIEKFMRYKGNDGILIDLNNLAGNS